MKVRNILAALLLMVAGLQTALAQKVVLHKTNGETIEYDVSELDSIVFKDRVEFPISMTCPDSNHPHAIDLGLPSGTKWCCCNVGAEMPESVGGYFAWGETDEKSEYDDVSYIFLNGQDTDGDGRIDQDGSYIDIGIDDIAGTDYDVAYVRMGDSWCMPSKAQQDELRDNCSIRGIQQNGVNGILVTGPNGGRIFMPSTGYYWKEHFYDDGGYGGYWSSSRIHTELINVFSLVFNTINGHGFWDWDASRCSYGRSVRPVRVNDINNNFCNLPARLTIENVQQAPVLYTACESMGEYCTITSDGQHFIFTDATNHTSSINITAITGYSGYYLGLSGFIVGKQTVPETGEDFVRVVCYDRTCPNCYQEYNITKPLALQIGGYAKCNGCGRTYNLNDIGNVSDGPAGRSLYRYRVNYVGNALVINNR